MLHHLSRSAQVTRHCSSGPSAQSPVGAVHNCVGQRRNYTTSSDTNLTIGSSVQTVLAIY